MEREERLHKLIDLIYEAATEPSGWAEVANATSQLFDGAAVLIGTSLPADGRLDLNYTVGLLPEFEISYSQHLIEGLPWRAEYTRGFTDRFGCMAEVFPGVEFSDCGFYTHWFEPQNLAPEWPIGHTIVVEGGTIVGGLGLFRMADSNPGPFRKDDLVLGDRLVTHLRRAFEIHSTLGGVRRERIAMAEVMDRLPTGVVLLDASRRPVVTNQAADRILAQRDGFRIDGGGPCAANSREHAMLQQILADVLEAAPGQELEHTGFMAISRPSGKRSFALMLTPLMDAPIGSQARDAVAAIFISDPEAGLTSATEVLETVYSLTHSEAELVRLLSEGMSLDEVAQARGVAINTARSHLKRVFSKTDTKRQGELVRLVLTGVASLPDE
jgi:DNA-binding CsgD family transcriptional regulator